MTPGNEAMFASEIMQKKLDLLCEGISKAFSLEGATDYLWTQYLIKETK